MVFGLGIFCGVPPRLPTRKAETGGFGWVGRRTFQRRFFWRLKTAFRKWPSKETPQVRQDKD